MYTVSILNSKTGQWRSTTEKTMTACVALTLGLATTWTIEDNATGQWFTDIIIRRMPVQSGIQTELSKRYLHTLRALLCRWISSLASKTVLLTTDKDELRHIMRLSDSAFYTQIQRFNSIVEQFNNNAVQSSRSNEGI